MLLIPPILIQDIGLSKRVHELSAVGVKKLPSADPFIVPNRCSSRPAGPRCYYRRRNGRSAATCRGGGRREASMDSESARMSSAAEARFRVDYPNSKPRSVKVVALDAGSQRVVKRLAQRSGQRATYFASIKFDGAPRTGERWSAWLSDLAGRGQ